MKHNLVLNIFKWFFIVIVVMCLIVVAWILFSAIAKDSIESHMKDGFFAYANVPSVSKFMDEMLYLSAVDAILEERSIDSIDHFVKTLRTNEKLKTWWFKILTKIRFDMAFYTSPNSHVVAIGDMGWRSSLTRLTSVLLKINPGLFDDFNNLSIEHDHTGEYFVYTLKDGNNVFIRFYKNLVIVQLYSTSDRFVRLSEKVNSKYVRMLKRKLKSTEKKTINLLADANFFKNLAPENEPILYNLFSSITFEDLSAVNLEFTDDNIVVKSRSEWRSDSPDLSYILQHRGSVPKIISKLPGSTEYVTLLNICDPDILWKHLQPFLDYTAKQRYKEANKMSKFILKKDIKDLFFSWMGKELGAFGVENISEPIFFVSVKDKRKCNAIFNEIFDSIFIDKDTSAVVDDIRMSRIVIPSWLNNLLKIFKIELPKPFYFIDGDFVFFSNSAEAISVYKHSSSSGNKLTKNKAWKKSMENLSPETSVFMYFNLDRSIPFFLQNQNLLKSMVEKYRIGIFSCKFDSKDIIKLDFFAVKTSEKSLTILPGFPKEISGKVRGNICCAKDKNGMPFVFWSTDKKIVSMSLATSDVQQISTDYVSELALDMNGDKLNAVWAVSKNGTVYKMNENLESYDGFPILTSNRVVGKPVLTSNGIVFSSMDRPVLVFIDNGGKVSYSSEMHTKMKSEPVYFNHYVLALPRSFDSIVYTFDEAGNFIDTIEPLTIDGISSIQPIVFNDANRHTLIANITEDGIFTLHYLDSEQQDNRQIAKVDLESTCTIQPIYSNGLKSILFISDTGLLKRLDYRGNIINGTPLKTDTTDDLAISLYDFSGDGIDEIFVSGGGNALYSYSSSLYDISGFPVAGTKSPYFMDISGNGIEDIITLGIDNQIYAFSGGSK